MSANKCNCTYAHLLPGVNLHVYMFTHSFIKDFSFHYVCMKTLTAQASLLTRAGLPEQSLFVYMLESLYRSISDENVVSPAVGKVYEAIFNQLIPVESYL